MRGISVLASLHTTGNYWEAGFWGVAALGFSVAALRRRDRARRMLVAGALTLAAFGGSDLVEVHTGAWWRPWWLLGWKAACVGALVLLYREYRKLMAGAEENKRKPG
ncbi:MAG: hypothetical protein IT449_03060 [Phycisphaerales bacterium]|nr:hypothetical protein [Phycisphaerales bacterium]